MFRRPSLPMLVFLLLLLVAVAGLLIDPGFHILPPWVDVAPVLTFAGHLQ